MTPQQVPQYPQGGAVQTLIKGEVLLHQNQGIGMYRNVGEVHWKRTKVQFILYFARSNRGLAKMTVFMPNVGDS